MFLSIVPTFFLKIQKKKKNRNTMPIRIYYLFKWRNYWIYASLIVFPCHCMFAFFLRIMWSLSKDFNYEKKNFKSNDIVISGIENGGRIFICKNVFLFKKKKNRHQWTTSYATFNIVRTILCHIIINKRSRYNH